jgi:hypothetical protein
LNEWGAGLVCNRLKVKDISCLADKITRIWAVAETPESLSTLQEQAKKSGVDKLTLEEIEKEIDAVRRIKHKKKHDAYGSL